VKPKRHKFLAPEKLEEAVAEVAYLADQGKMQVALIGGFALQLYGSPRLTGDIDVVAKTRVRGLPAGEALSFGGIQTCAPNGVPVDWVIRNDAYTRLYDEALRRAGRIRGVPILVVRPEYLVAMKMVAGRTKDAADLEWILISGAVDVKAARVVVERHLGPYGAQELDQLVVESRWKASRGRT
jgi:Nucleotidyltransferase of unknown function (DUF6036)